MKDRKTLWSKFGKTHVKLQCWDISKAAAVPFTLEWLVRYCFSFWSVFMLKYIQGHTNNIHSYKQKGAQSNKWLNYYENTKLKWLLWKSNFSRWRTLCRVKWAAELLRLAAGKCCRRVVWDHRRQVVSPPGCSPLGPRDCVSWNLVFHQSVRKWEGTPLLFRA